MDKLDRGFLAKTQIQTHVCAGQDLDLRLKNEMLKFLRGYNDVNLDLIAFFRISHYLVSIGSIHY